MKTSLASRCLCVLVLLASTTVAQTQTATPALTEEAQRYLNAPVWHLNYTVTTKTSQPGYGGNRTLTTERVINGTMQLALRTQGPTLSVITGDAKPPGLPPQVAAQQAQALAAGNLSGLSAGLSSVSAAQVEQMRTEFDAYFGNYANWILGANIDEEKSEQENERRMQQIMDQGNQAFERYRWNYSGTSHVGGYDRGAANGSGTVQFGGTSVAFEIDGARRKFKLLLPLHFTDSLQTMDALRGQEELYMGTIHYERREVKTGLHSGEHTLVLRPEYKIIEGNLPAGFANISGQSLHSILAHDGTTIGSLSVDYVLSPNPPVPVELWIDPPPNYGNWQPIAKDDEKTAGDTIPIKIVLQKPGGGAPQFKPSRYEFFLLETSNEKGICMNWPPEAPANPSATNAPGANAPAAPPPPPYDLQFEYSQNQGMFVEDEGLRLVDTAPDQLERQVVVSCFDYGAYGEFAVHAVLQNGQRVEGIVRGTTDKKRLKLPERKDGSKIASVYLLNNGVSNLADDDDNENDPVGDRFKGDGLTLYEEYRGFMVGDAWTPGTPKKKDVFVINELRGLPSVVAGVKLFESLTSLKVHDLLRDNQVPADGRINFSRTSGPHVVDQHAIRIEAGEWVLFGNTAARVTGKVGTPGTALTVSVPPDLGINAGANYMASTVAHEMLHSCNVYHHGEKDEHMRWFYRPGEGQFYEQGRGAGSQPVAITVKLEDGRVVTPSRFFAPGKTEQVIWLGLKHGQHSGAEQCVMRYDTALAYPSSRDPIVRYLTQGEPVGTQICRSPAGTGVNDPGHPPESRYQTAANAGNGGLNPDGTHQVINDRGNCLDQVRVNDKDREPRR